MSAQFSEAGRVIEAYLEAHLPKIASHGDVFIHDNARTFKAAIVPDWLLP
jgi:hypothetical protein